MMTNNLIDSLEKDLPLEQRLKNMFLFPGGADAKAEEISSANIGFYEKLFFILGIYGNNKKLAIKKFNQYVVSNMTIGYVISEMLKPELIEIGQTLYPDLDFRFVFSDRHAALSQDFITRTIVDNDIKKPLDIIAKEAITKEYESALKDFAEVIGHICNDNQPFIKGKGSPVFKSENEKDYVIKLFEWAQRQEGFKRNSNKEILEFYSLLNSKGKKPVNKDIEAQLEGMATNHVSIYGIEFEGDLSLLTFRAKTLRSAKTKAAGAYAAYLTFHGENIADKAYSEFPWHLDQIIKERKQYGMPVKEYKVTFEQITQEISELSDGYIDWKTHQTDSQRKEIWRKVKNKEAKQKIWEEMPKRIRSEIMTKLGDYGSLICKYTSWQDLVEVFNDLYAITGSFNTETYRQVAEKRIISPLFNKTLPSLMVSHLPELKRVEYIENKKYNGIHLNISAQGSNNWSELHITNLSNLLSNDTVGEGCHSLMQQQRITELVARFPNSEKIMDNILPILEKKDRNGGYLTPIKSSFTELDKHLNEVGLYFS